MVVLWDLMAGYVKITMENHHLTMAEIGHPVEIAIEIWLVLTGT